MTMSSTAIQAALAAGANAAGTAGVAVNIAVVDGGGNLAGFLRMPDAFQASIDIAIDKAWTANSFGMSTADFGRMLDGEAPMVRDGLLRRPRVVAFPGGRPVRHDGKLIGGIGVSGASAEQDDAISMAGLKALLET